MVKTPSFQCRWHGFDPWSGTKLLHTMPCSMAKKKKNQEAATQQSRSCLLKCASYWICLVTLNNMDSANVILTANYGILAGIQSQVLWAVVCQGLGSEMVSRKGTGFRDAKITQPESGKVSIQAKACLTPRSL